MDLRFSRRAGAGAGFFLALGPLAAAGALGLAAAGVAAGLAAATSRTRRGLSQQVLRTGPAGALALAFLVWTAASFAWSPYQNPGAALWIALGWPALALAAWAGASALDADRPLLRRAVVAGTASAVVLLLLEAGGGYGMMRAANPAQADVGPMLRNLGRGGAVVALLAFPAAACLARLKAPAWAIAGWLVAAGAAAGAFGMDANLLAFAAGLAGAGLALLAPGLAVAGGLIGLAAALCLAPVLARAAAGMGAGAGLPPSWEQRLDMWGFTADRIAERPLFGWGLEAARTFDAPVSRAGQVVTQIQIHPHSAPLQIWLETGAVGVALAAAGLIALAFWARRAFAADRTAAAGAAGAVAAFSALAGVSYGAWQEWLAAAVAAGAAAVAASRLLAQERTPLPALETFDLDPP